MELAQLGRWPGIEGRVALVTGASRGIGRATARALALQGALVVGTATTEPGAGAVSERLRAISPEARGLVLDVADPASVQALFATLSEAKTPPTILVNNAGITRDNLFARMKPDEWDVRVGDQSLLPLLGLQGGDTWHDAGALGAHPQHRFGRWPDRQPGAGELCCGQVRHDRIREIPGEGGRLQEHYGEHHRTRIHRDRHDPGDERDPNRTHSWDRFRHAVSVRRNDVAAAVVYLASDAARYITGETLNVNGGLHMS